MQLDNPDEDFYNTIKEKISKKIPLSQKELDVHHSKIKEENLLGEKLQQQSIGNRLAIKNDIEKKYANWISAKEIYPHVTWYVKATDINEDKTEYLVEIGDYIEFVDTSKSFNEKDEYTGSINTQVKSLTNQCIYLALVNNEQYLLGENAKIIRFKKHEMYKKQDKTIWQKFIIQFLKIPPEIASLSFIFLILLLIIIIILVP